MSDDWRHRPEGGSRFALSLMRFIALYGGRRLGRVCLYPIAAYFYLRRRAERLASRQYLERVLDHPVRPWHVFKHIHAFATTTLDRVFLLARGERGFEVESQGLDALDECIAMGRGVILLGSHHGSFEALRAIGARRPDVSLRVLLDKQKTPAMTELLEALSPGVGACVIDASQDGTSITLAMAEACAEGALVALLADRARDHEMQRVAPFLGQNAPFPVGPWLLAHALQVPVMLCFGLYLGGNRYRLVFEPFAERVSIPRQQRLPALDAVLERYAQRLEHYVRLAPYNWFNFYDFWQHDPQADARRLDPAADGGPRSESAQV